MFFLMYSKNKYLKKFPPIVQVPPIIISSTSSAMLLYFGKHWHMWPSLVLITVICGKQRRYNYSHFKDEKNQVHGYNFTARTGPGPVLMLSLYQPNASNVLLPLLRNTNLEPKAKFCLFSHDCFGIFVVIWIAIRQKKKLANKNTESRLPSCGRHFLR